MMNRILTILLINFLFPIAVQVQAQITPQEAIKEIRRGINIGNTLDPPDGEGTWNNGPVQEYYFDDYKAAGFTCIRIPITWYKHTSSSSPYTIDGSFLGRVEQIVDWGLARGLYIIINAHHEEEIKSNYSNTAIKNKFDSIWSQIAVRFKNKSEKLFFEIINEPNPISQANLNELNTRVLAVIRKTNPTRIVLFSGIAYSNSAELLATKIPDVNDPYLMAYFHSYDPWNFAGLGTGTYGTDADVNATIAKFDQVANWSASKNIPVVLDEFGAVGKCDYNSKMFYLATVTEQALNHNIAFCTWDDGGDFQSYLRSQRKWNDNKDVFIYTYKESPTKLKFSAVKDTITLTWVNRTTKNDSIIIDRKTSTSDFVQIGKVGPQDTQFRDSVLKASTVYYYRLRTNIKDSINLYSYPQTITSVSNVRKPYSGSAIKIPNFIQAENYDIGGEGLTFHDTESANQGGAYRVNDGVDIQPITDGGYMVGYVNTGEWMEYAITVPDSTEYRIDATVSSVDGGGAFKYIFKKGTKSITSSIVTVPKTNGWENFQKISTSVVLPAGNLYMRVYTTNGSPAFNYDRFNIVNPLITKVDRAFNELFYVYPNPATDRVVVDTDAFDPTIMISNLSGQAMIQKRLNKNDMEVELDVLHPGVYLMKITSGSKTQWLKLIKR